MIGPSWLSIALKIIGLTLTQFISLLGGLVIAGFILGVLERQANGRVIHLFGMKGIYGTAWLGTPIHELSHAAMCLFFRHRVTEIKLLQAVDSGGTMGYVRHAYNPNSFYQRIGNLFIGIAPLIGGSLVIAAAAKWMLPNVSGTFFDYVSGAPRLFSFFDLPSWLALNKAVIAVFRSLFAFENLTNPYFWLFLVIAVCVSSRMSLSREDIRGAWSGAGALLVFLLLVNALSALLDPTLRGQMMYWIARCNFLLMIMLSMSVFFSFLVFFASHFAFVIMGLLKK
ncbi:hypothetical protein [Sporolactobacillus nakayamae]|uniref:Uncharacterized protein n=1 Tax=Sporolactobacillus nakayamae TaxID=269670 RepID=A0A1I2Q1T1_9BACL|nr:hypothetical protein [Sporolactobacillus nakayamae]SFG21870.1 hypothetical protein SAMN02982927_01002 [Sporolactobacillus nakayamae]